MCSEISRRGSTLGELSAGFTPGGMKYSISSQPLGIEPAQVWGLRSELSVASKVIPKSKRGSLNF